MFRVKKEEIRNLFAHFSEENGLAIRLSFAMPEGYETANGTFDVAENTLFLNGELLDTVPDYETVFFLFHELRHAVQYLFPERFSEKVRESLPYVVLYDGTCFRLQNGDWETCKLDGSEEYFTRAYENLPYERDANDFAKEETGKRFPDKAKEIEALYGMFVPGEPFSEAEYRELFAKIDEEAKEKGNES